MRKITLHLLTLMLRFGGVIFLLEGFSNTITFLADSIVAGATPKRFNNGILAVPVPGRAENLCRIVITVVAVTVAAILAIVAAHLATSVV